MRKWTLSFCVIGLFAGHDGGAATQAKDLRAYYDEQFGKHPAETGLLREKARTLRIQALPKARLYRTALRNEWKAAKEPNFSGRYYAFNQIGCGTSCQVVFVADWHTGALYSAPIDESFEVRKNNQLLIMKPYSTCGAAEGPPIFFLFKGGKFQKIEQNPCL
jgi:hypothetical protein